MNDFSVALKVLLFRTLFFICDMFLTDFYQLGSWRVRSSNLLRVPFVLEAEIAGPTSRSQIFDVIRAATFSRYDVIPLPLPVICRRAEKIKLTILTFEISTHSDLGVLH